MSTSGGQVAPDFLAVLRNSGVEGLVAAIASVVENWLTVHGIEPGQDRHVSYKTWREAFDRPPDGPVALVMMFDNWSIKHLVDDDEAMAWLEFVETLGFEAHSWNHMTQLLLAAEDGFADELQEQLEFDWAARLVASDYALIYDQVFGYFAANAKRLHSLRWREFEEFLASVFVAQGYRTVLGPGRDDQGVDIRLTENAVYGEEVTVVQAKRYRQPIELDLVASLLGVTVDQGADRGLLVTTSRFLPSAKAFAGRHNQRLKLATSDDVAEWCAVIAAKRTNTEWLHETARSWRVNPDKIVVAQFASGMVFPKWATVVAETPTAARLAVLDGIRAPASADDQTVGHQVPDLRTHLAADRSITARLVNQGWLADDGAWYHLWDRQPHWYDYND